MMMTTMTRASFPLDRLFILHFKNERKNKTKVLLRQNLKRNNVWKTNKNFIITSLA